ncbi:MAG: hypothetical protein Q7S95_01100 [bacterium]|nr:hypothetical protein [bacterium]
MTIAGAREKCKTWIGKVPRDVLIVGVLLLSVSASFGLGFLAGRDGVGKDGISIEIVPAPEAIVAGLPAEASAKAGAYVASKNGSKYYLTTCSGAARISEANKVWFASAAAATAAGYAPAASCKGL